MTIGGQCQFFETFAAFCSKILCALPFSLTRNSGEPELLTDPNGTKSRGRYGRDAICHLSFVMRRRRLQLVEAIPELLAALVEVVE
jgi:hypothetical protein